MRLAALLHVDAGPPQQGGGDSSSQSTWATGQERQNLAAALASTLSRAIHAQVPGCACHARDHAAALLPREGYIGVTDRSPAGRVPRRQPNPPRALVIRRSNSPVKQSQIRSN